jgi:myo-inositol-1-phosphate synthase
VPAELHIQESLSYKRLNHFRFLLEDDRKDLITPSMTYAYAAFMECCSYINFTPNTGASIGALQELAERQGVPYYGNDGKTGETLIKTALAPMFAYRNLQVLSWEGINILGNNDGKTLDNPDNRANKVRNKEGVLEQILGYPVHSGVNINYVPSLGDWKTAWDLIHFQGFLDVKMTMQFTWQGCDSILAAPLVLDMIRFSEFAARHKESGPMRHLAAFFKNPLTVNEMALYPQFEMLLSYTWKHLSRQKESKINKI